MDLSSIYLLSYLSGLNSTSSAGSLNSLHSTGSSSSASGISDTLSFPEILRSLQNDATTRLSSNLSAGSSMDAMFQRAAEKYNVDADLLKAIGKTESNFNAGAVSSAGAIGVMQLMPGTARSLGISDPYDAEQNIMGGAKYISQMLERYDGDIEKALAAYNAGPGNVDKYGGIPPFKETQNYVEKVMGYLKEDDLNIGTTENAAAINTATSDSNTIEINKDTLVTMYTLLRAQMELQMANNMFAWNNSDDSSNGGLFSL